MMKCARIDPYRAFALGPDGTRQPLAAHAVIVEVRPGIEIEINFAPHPNFAGRLVMLTPRRSRMRRLQEAGKMDDFAVVFGGSNVLHVLVERRIRSPENPEIKPKQAQGATEGSPRRRRTTPRRSRR